MNSVFAKIKSSFKDTKGSILLSVFIINVIALIIGMLLSSLAVEQLRNSYRNIRSSSALGVSQSGLEDALATITELEKWYQAHCVPVVNDPLCQDVKDRLDILKLNGGVCASGVLSSGKECSWYWEQDSVIGTIKKDHAVTYDISDIGNSAFSMVWQCPGAASAATSGSGMVVTFISENPTDTFIIPDGTPPGKIAVRCSYAPGEIDAFTSASNPVSAPIGDGGGPIMTGQTVVDVPANVKYLRIRAVSNDVRYLRLLRDTNVPPSDYEAYIQDNQTPPQNYAFRDVITSEGIDGISRYTSLARTKDLQVPSLFDFVLYTEGTISK